MTGGSPLSRSLPINLWQDQSHHFPMWGGWRAVWGGGDLSRDKKCKREESPRGDSKVGKVVCH